MRDFCHNLWIVGLAIVLLLASVAGCGTERSQPAAPAEQNEDLPDQEGWDSIITASKDDRIAAVIRYGHMRGFSKRRVVEFDQGIVVDFYNPKGEHTSKLTADGGRLDEKTEEVEAIGNVVVISDSGMTLRTERLRWDRRGEKIVTDQFVTITTAEGDTLYGRGFESDPNLNNWLIRQPSGVSSKRIVLERKRRRSVPDSVIVAADTSTTQSAAGASRADSLLAPLHAGPDTSTAPLPREEVL
jgi:LPS export ABC transporter protein LptC